MHTIRSRAVGSALLLAMVLLTWRVTPVAAATTTTIFSNSFDSQSTGALVTGAGFAYAYKQYSTSYSTHTLTFSLQLGPDFTVPHLNYVVLAQTVPLTSSTVGKVDVILPADNRIRLDYFDSAGRQQVLAGRFVVPKGSWHTVALRETVGAGNTNINPDGSFVHLPTAQASWLQRIPWLGERLPWPVRPSASADGRSSITVLDLAWLYR